MGVELLEKLYHGSTHDCSISSFGRSPSPGCIAQFNSVVFKGLGLAKQRAAEIYEGSKVGWIFFPRQTGRGLCVQF